MSAYKVWLNLLLFYNYCIPYFSPLKLPSIDAKDVILSPRTSPSARKKVAMTFYLIDNIEIKRLS